MHQHQAPPERQRDVALSFAWSTDDTAWLESLGLPKGGSRRFQQAMTSILLQARIVAETAPDRWCSHSRNKNHYRDGARYQGDAYSFSTVPGAVDLLTALGLLECEKAAQGRQSIGRQSRHRASAGLVRAIPAPLLIPGLSRKPRELIRLKDGQAGQARLIPYRETERTARMRKECARFNEAIGGACVTIASADSADALIREAGLILCPAMRAVYRVFSRASFDMGGRFYGFWLQGAPATMRDRSLIDGEPTAEPDFRQLHAQLSYALIGRPDLADQIEQADRGSDGDAYAMAGWDRSLVKRAWNIALNAETEAGARAAIADQIEQDNASQGESRPDSAARAARLLDGIKAKHRPLAEAGVFHSGAGLRLQRIDSGMAANVMRPLARQGITAIPIHDSFRVAARHTGAAEQAMSEARERAISALSSTRNFVPDSALGSAA